MPKIPHKSRATVLKSLPQEAVWQPDPTLLLHPNIPKPLHGVAPRVVLGANWWAREKRLVYKSTNYHCQACGVFKSDALLRQWLEAHEIYDIDYRLGRATYVKAVPLCHCCHNYIHDGRLQALLKQGLVSHYKYSVIMRHGDRVLSNAGLSKERHDVREAKIAQMDVCGSVAAWSEWRMVVDGVEYPPKFPSFESWFIAMSKGFDE